MSHISPTVWCSLRVYIYNLHPLLAICNWPPSCSCPKTSHRGLIVGEKESDETEVVGCKIVCDAQKERAERTRADSPRFHRFTPDNCYPEIAPRKTLAMGPRIRRYGMIGSLDDKVIRCRIQQSLDFGLIGRYHAELSSTSFVWLDEDHRLRARVC